MAAKDTTKVRRGGDTVWRVVDGEIVVLLPYGGVIHALKGCGTRVWELIEKETAISDIVQTICLEYEVEPQKAREEINEFVNKLAAMKLVEIMPAESKEMSR